MSDALFDYAVIVLVFCCFAMLLMVLEQAVKRLESRARRRRSARQWRDAQNRMAERRMVPVDELVIRHLRGRHE